MNVRQSAPTNDLLSAHFSEAFPLKIQDYFSPFLSLPICVSGWCAIKKINKNVANLFKLWYSSNIDKPPTR